MKRLTEYEQDEFDGTVIAAPKYERTQMGDADLKEWVYRAAAKLAYYEDAEEQERLVKLPLSFGDQIFEIYNNGIERKIIQKTVRGFTVFEDYLYVETNNGVSLNAKKFGEIFFKTYDEAETKLAEINKEE